MATEEEDRSIVRRCLRDEPEASAELLHRYEDRIFRFIRCMVPNPADAEDIAQQAFIKAFRNLRSYDDGRRFSTWLLSIARNATIDFLRAKDPEALSVDDTDAPLEVRDPGAQVEMITESRLQQELIQKLLVTVPPLYREVLLLRHQEDLGYKEIAELLRIPEGTVRIRLHRGREMLRAKLAAFDLPG